MALISLIRTGAEMSEPKRWNVRDCASTRRDSYRQLAITSKDCCKQPTCQLFESSRFGYHIVMNSKGLIAIDAQSMRWEERYIERIGLAIFRKELFADPETGVLVRLVCYPAGVINPKHTHPCGHGMYVLEGNLVTHKGTF